MITNYVDDKREAVINSRKDNQALCDDRFVDWEDLGPLLKR
jgi:hypothetical protein